MAYPPETIADSPISGVVTRISDEYVGAAEITPSDSEVLDPQYMRALFVGVAGDVKVTMHNGTIVTLPLAAKTVYKIVVSRVWATGTTATGIVGLY